MTDAPTTAATATSTARRLGNATRIGLPALGIAVALIVTIVMLARLVAIRPTTQSLRLRNAVVYTPHRSRLDVADWATLQNAIRLRTMALAPGRTALYRSFAAYMGLNGLTSLHPVGPGRCATAVSYLYDNLLDLHHALPGEDWRPLRRLIRKQPSLSVCAPRATARVTYVG
jgi:hypothetical protein